MKTKRTYPDSAASGASVKKICSVATALVAVGLASQASSDYGPATWRPACSGHWNGSGNGKRFYVEHDMEGYYASGIVYLQRCDITVSIHYAINGKQDAASDYAAGDITQMVADANYAWHVRCWNGYCMGTEHEGFRSNPAWYTSQMYDASAALTKSKAEKYGFAKDRNHIVGHDAKSSSAWVSWAGPNLGINASCNTHDDPGPYWDWNGYMARINNAANNINIFYAGTDNALWTEWWVGNAWGGPATLGGTVAANSSPCTVTTGAYVSAFYRGSDNALYIKQSNGSTWSGPTSLGGTGSSAMTSDPSATIAANGNYNIFYRGADGALWTKYWTPASGWGGPASLGGAMAAGSSPSAVTTGVYVTAYYRGTDNALYLNQWTGSAWSGQFALGGTGSSAMASNPSAVILANGNNNIFYRGADGALWTKYWTPASGWGGPASLSGAMAAGSSPSAVTTGVYVTAFYRGTDNALYLNQWTGSAWTGQFALGGTGNSAMASNPSAIILANSNNNIFYRGVDGALWTKYWTPATSWGGPVSLGGAIAAGGSPSAIAHQ